LSTCFQIDQAIGTGELFTPIAVISLTAIGALSYPLVKRKGNKDGSHIAVSVTSRNGT